MSSETIMNLEAGDWFFRLVDKSSSIPSERLLAVFSVTEQLLFSTKFSDDLTINPFTFDVLKNYLTSTAISAKATNPADLSGQLIILLIGAIAEELHNPESQALQNAMTAAKVIIDRACEPKRNTLKYFSAVACFVICVTTTIYWLHLNPISMQPTLAYHNDNYHVKETTANEDSINPFIISAIFDLQEKVREGVCPAPHLLDIPQGQMIAYMNVINFRHSDNPVADRENLQAFLTWYNQELSRECYYPRMSGYAKVSWR